MFSAGDDRNTFVIHTEDEAVLLVDVDAREAGKVALEQFEFAKATVSVSADVLDEVVGFLDEALIFLQSYVFIPRTVVPAQIPHQSVTSMSS